MDTRSYREDLLKSLVTHGADSFKEVVRVAALIEDKAQKTAALAGVFLAAGLGFIKPENLKPDSPLGGFWTLLPLTLAIIGLIATVLVCLAVLWVRRQAAPIPMPAVRKMVRDLSALPDAALTIEVQDQSRLEVAKRWTNILQEQTRLNEKKAWGVRFAQVCLTMSILLVATSLLVVLVGSVADRMISAFKG